jgi:predicted small lipoprotein YifL
MINYLIIIISLFFLLTGCGKVGPLALSEDQVDKSVITYPCDEACIEKFEAEKKRQQSVTIQTD